MRVGSLFSGVGGFDLGFHGAGYEIAWQCEIEPFPRRILCQRFPGVPVYGDVRGMGKSTTPRVDVLVGGFPCQDLSVAGRREGLSGERSGLFFQFVRLIRELQPRWWVIENVPGFLTSAAGLDFATALRELDACGQVGSWRILDSQYFRLAQRRERVFLVGGPRGLVERATEVLFESASRSGDSPTSREAGADLTGPVAGGAYGTGRRSEDDPNLVAFTQNQRNEVREPKRAGALSAEPGMKQQTYIAATLKQRGRGATDEVMDNLQRHGAGVRRLTPLECERLQGFPDGWTCLCGEGHRGSQFCTCKDTPRYKALGNAVSVPVAEWIARQILNAEMSGGQP